MNRSTTTSVRLPAELRTQLDEAANNLHRGINWIIIHALEKYLEDLRFTLLAKEAQRQSILASQTDDSEETKIWEDNSDTTGWDD